MGTPARVPAVRAVLVHDDKFMLVQHHNQVPENAGKWGLPGGRIEATDHNLIGALHRELFEEFHMTADIIGFVAMYTYRERAHHIFCARPQTMELVLDPREILNVEWWTLTEVRQCYANGMLHTGFELAAIRASLARYGALVEARKGARVC